MKNLTPDSQTLTASFDNSMAKRKKLKSTLAPQKLIFLGKN